jgi:transcription factor YY
MDDLGSDVITEVEIQPEMQEVEIESLPVDMHLSGDDDNLEISVDDDVTLGHEVMLESHEEVVGYGDDPNMSLVGEDGILLDDIDDDDDDDDHAGASHFHHVTLPSVSRHHRLHHGIKAHSRSKPCPSKKRFGNRGLDMDPLSSAGHLTITPSSSHHNRNIKKWEPKQVQIRTLEGEFSVTMWASGADDGKTSA